MADGEDRFGDGEYLQPGGSPARGGIAPLPRCHGIRRSSILGLPNKKLLLGVRVEAVSRSPDKSVLAVPTGFTIGTPFVLACRP